MLIGCLRLCAPYLLPIARRSVKKCSVGPGGDSGTAPTHPTVVAAVAIAREPQIEPLDKNNVNV
jgi:hypothetical protein